MYVMSDVAEPIPGVMMRDVVDAQRHIAPEPRFKLANNEEQRTLPDCPASSKSLGDEKVTVIA